ncbi:FAD:protein FMN transferase, partial [Kaarinaea lacus]
MDAPQLQYCEDYWLGRFNAMASPCEILIDTHDSLLAQHLTNIAQQEALRIEHKLSRYRQDNIIHKINNAQGATVKVDEETAHMLDYAAQCYELSEGMFDVTSGVLREVWKFDASDRIPSAKQVKKILARIGWNKVYWRSPKIRMPMDMQIDLGGIGKEYAVDRVVLLLREAANVSCLVNFGGDIATTGPRGKGKGWMVGVETPDSSPNAVSANTKVYELQQGALATSGDARRYLLKDGVRYSHILNPRTGWPMQGAPRSVTVIADTCTEAGILATLAMLHGSQAEAFLNQQGVKYWCIR